MSEPDLMPRLRNVNTGAVVSCSEETAARLGSEWEPVEEKKADAPRRSTKK